MECYQEVFILREQLGVMEEKHRQRIAELEKTLRERDQTIAQLRLQHQKQFKANKSEPDSPPIKVKAGRRRAIRAGTARSRINVAPMAASSPGDPPLVGSGARAVRCAFEQVHEMGPTSPRAGAVSPRTARSIVMPAACFRQPTWGQSMGGGEEGCLN
jgi:TolA-binding protein